MAAGLHEVTPSEIDLANCDREPIHIPGAIQPHGVLLVLQEPELRVVQASENGGEMLGITTGALPGSAPDMWLTADSAGALRAALGTVEPVRLRSASGDWWDAVLHRNSGGLVLELEPAPEEDSRSVAGLYARIRGALARLQDARHLQELCRVIAEEVRAVTELDRVMVYRFDPDWNGEVVAEARAEHMDSFLGLHFPASDVPAQARALYRRNWLRLIPDVTYRPSPLVPPVNPATGALLDMSDSVLRSVSPIHLEYLRNMEVGASMSVSLLRGGELWGLVACHHAQPKHVAFEVRTACELMGQTFSVQLGAVADAEGQERVLEIAAAGIGLFENTTGSEDWAGALAERGPDLLRLTGAGGAAIRRGSRMLFAGQTPPQPALEGLFEWLGQEEREVLHTDRLPDVFPPAAAYADVASGLLATSLGTPGDWLLWFRPEVVRTVKWAGDPRKPVSAEPDGVRLHPRRSFQAWRETVRGRSTPWFPAEVRAASELRGRIVDVVLRQAERLARLNQELRRSNEELDAFTYIASHDLKEPLRGIHNYATMLLSEQAVELDGEAVRRLETMIRLTRRMDGMLDSLLTYSRAGQLELRPQKTDLNRVVSDVLEALGPRIDEVGAEIRFGRPLPTVRCDVVRTAAIFQNLIANALKYNDKPERWVEVGYQADAGDGSVVLYVRDNGIGIRAKHWDTIFHIFRRLHGRDQFGGGTGAGLTIVRKLVERQGGRIWLESVPGEGTTFSFTLGS